jgi:hypothetical protein
VAVAIWIMGIAFPWAMTKIKKIAYSWQGSILIMKKSEVSRVHDGNFREPETKLVQENHVIRAPCRAAKENLSIWVGAQNRHKCPYDSRQSQVGSCGWYLNDHPAWSFPQ